MTVTYGIAKRAPYKNVGVISTNSGSMMKAMRSGPATTAPIRKISETEEQAQVRRPVGVGQVARTERRESQRQQNREDSRGSARPWARGPDAAGWRRRSPGRRLRRARSMRTNRTCSKDRSRRVRRSHRRRPRGEEPSAGPPPRRLPVRLPNSVLAHGCLSCFLHYDAFIVPTSTDRLIG